MRSIERFDTVERPSLRGVKIKKVPADGFPAFQCAKVTFAFPFDSIGCNLPTLAATVCGQCIVGAS
ncbi:MAG: hypothetical protein KDA72_06365 [Planctomycetales bacterium]|nr:hypothetical protein [Planctomycetales bacterium]